MNSTCLITLLGCAVAAVGCAQENEEKFEVSADEADIVNGGIALQSDLVTRSTVAIFDKTSGVLTCSGTLVGPKTVLSAGHCFDGINDHKFVVVFGIKAPTTAAGFAALPSATIRDASRIEVNTGYQARPPLPRSRPTDASGTRWREAGVDAAVVLLSSNAPDGYVPVTIPRPTDLPLKQGNTVFVAGFGTTGQNTKSDGVLRFGSMKLEALSPRAPEEILALPTTAKTNTCYGDSGGSLYVMLDDGRKLPTSKRLVLVGITSAARDRFVLGCNTGGLFADARYQIPWITAAR